MLRLEDVSLAITDCEHKTAPTQDEGIPLIRTTNIRKGRLDLAGAHRISEVTYREWTKRGTPEFGDLILAREAPVGEVGWVPPDATVCLGQRTVLIRPDSTCIEPRYLLYLLLSDRIQHAMRSRAEGSTTPHLNVADVRSLPLPLLPSLGEQRAIAGVLGALDDKIELNRRINETLVRLATDHFILRYWRAPDRGTWNSQPLGEHLDVVRGLSYTGAGLTADGVPLHNLNSIYEGGGYKREGLKRYSGDFNERHVVTASDVIVANTEQGFDSLLIAFPAIVPSRFGDSGLFSHHLYRVRPRPSSPLTSRLIYLLLLKGPLRTEIAGYSNGTTVNMLPMDALQKPIFRVPPTDVAARIDALVAPLFARAEAAENESETLAELRDTLLPKLISGELRVRDAEAAVESAGA